MTDGQKREVAAERTWLGVDVSLGISGAGLIASTAAASLPVLGNPAFYIGCALCLLAAYVGLGVFVTRVPLPKLPSERSAERLHGGLDAWIVEGLALDRRKISSEEEWQTWRHDTSVWAQRTYDWLVAEVSEARADAFTSQTVMAAHIPGTYNSEHNDQRLALQARVEWLQRLKDAGP